MMRGISLLVTLLFMGLFVSIASYLAIEGSSSLSWDYLWQLPHDLGRKGGIGPILLNTVVMVVLAAVIAIPFSACAAALYSQLLTRAPSRIRDAFLLLTEIGIGTPRIVWGLTGAAIFGASMGLGISIAAGVLTLSFLLAPILTSGFIAAFDNVGKDLELQSRALGLTQLQTFWLVLIPDARSALLSTVMLAIGRGFGDAAALLFTSGVAHRLPGTMFDPAATLSVWIFHLITAIPGGEHSAYAAALVLFVMTFMVQAMVSLIDLRGTKR